LVDTTLQLVEVSSPTGDERELCDIVEARLRSISGLIVERVGDSVAAHRPWTGRPRVALVGHLDTVPKSDAQEPTRVEGDRLFGLGSSDMKAGDAVMLALLELVEPSEMAYDLCIVLYDAEEGPYEQSGLGPLFDALDWIKTVDLAFCLEPSDNVVQVGCVGSLHAKVTVSGRACHSARPWQGENAIHKAGNLMTRLGALEPKVVTVAGHKFSEVISATIVSGGGARNVIPSACVFNINFRFAPGKSEDAALAELVELVGDLAEVELIDSCPSGSVVDNSPLFDRFLSLSGADVTAKQAWTDVARFAQIGVDAVNYGPGISSQAHQATEYVDIDLIVDSYGSFHRFLTTP
jgi:succinyl-diaminopimelate desuccinylase